MRFNNNVQDIRESFATECLFPTTSRMFAVYNQQISDEAKEDKAPIFSFCLSKSAPPGWNSSRRRAASVLQGPDHRAPRTRIFEGVTRKMQYDILSATLFSN
jgi:hypothetical protein